MFHVQLLARLEHEQLTVAELARQLPEVGRQTVQKWVKGTKKKGAKQRQPSVPDGISMVWLMQRFQWTPEDTVGAQEAVTLSPAAALDRNRNLDEQEWRLTMEARLQRIESLLRNREGPDGGAHGSGPTDPGTSSSSERAGGT